MGVTCPGCVSVPTKTNLIPLKSSVTQSFRPLIYQGQKILRTCWKIRYEQMETQKTLLDIFEDRLSKHLPLLGLIHGAEGNRQVPPQAPKAGPSDAYLR